VTTRAKVILTFDNPTTPTQVTLTTVRTGSGEVNVVIEQAHTYGDEQAQRMSVVASLNVSREEALAWADAFRIAANG
jgi:uncharacterized protein YaiE (UPF0345 family)